MPVIIAAASTSNPWPYAERTGSAGVPRRYRSFPLLIVL